MGESAAETVEEIEVIRDRLDDELQELQERLPAPVVMSKRLVGLAVGGGLAGTAFWFVVRRIRSSRASNKASSEPVQAVIQLLPDNVAEEVGQRVSTVLEDGSWRPMATAIGGLWLLMRLAELRQLRRLSRVMARP